MVIKYKESAYDNLDKCAVINSVLKSTLNNNRVCPYDGIKFYTDNKVSWSLLKQIKGHEHPQWFKNEIEMYKYQLNYRLFFVQWGVALQPSS
ncbi:hypothetical protein N784_11740 [Pontibacillus litoralis JSM 072002]|uniref:Uncharacterized protein n=1 Tax=Pontibacillus litoralis JSM 072002 TaxID=1385512 RepID=A0A0A5HMI8_9BACI|nr:hypothetical protein N784_11740 [Pontibacillus litoralis JSM 072002]